MIALKINAKVRVILLSVICTLIQFAFTEDLILYKGDYYVGHKYAWQGTPDGGTLEPLISNVLNRPWLIAISKPKNIIYWTDDRGIIGSWNINSRHSSVVYKQEVGSWDESRGPALTGIDVDDINNHLYYSFNGSIYRLDLSQTNPSATLIASYDNLVFNPRFSASRNALFFCLQNAFEQGDLVQVSLSDPTTLTTLVHNTSTGSIVQQLFIDETTNTLYYNSPGTLTMLGVSLAAPYNQVFTSVYLGLNPTFFDFNPTLQTFVLNDLRFSTTYKWSLGANQPSPIYSPVFSQVRGVKFFNDTHVIAVSMYSGSPVAPIGSLLALVNINNPNDTTLLDRSFAMGSSLIFDKKYCDFYFVANPKTWPEPYLDQIIFRKNIDQDGTTVYQKRHMPGFGSINSISLDVDMRNLIVSRANTSRVNTISYFPIDQPETLPISIIDSRARSFGAYVVDDQTGDIYYFFHENEHYTIYRIDAASISKNWMANVGYPIIGGIDRFGGSLAINSGKNIYYTNGAGADVQVVKANYDGSGSQVIFTIKKVYGVQGMRWDPSSNRLFILSTPNTTWQLISIKSDGSNPIYTSLGYRSGGSNDNYFFSMRSDPFSSWVYMNAVNQPIRVKKDGSVVENLPSYVPINTPMNTLSFDELTGDIYYGDAQCSIKKINVNNTNKAEPRITPFEIAWQGDYKSYDLSSFIHDKKNQIFWVLQKDRHVSYPKSRYTVGVVPGNGGPVKQLFDFPQNINPPFAVDANRSKIFAYYSPLNGAIVMMDAYTGSNLVTLKEFKYPQYTTVSVTAMTLDPRTGILYYTLDTVNGKTSNLESYDPRTNTTKHLWQSSQRLNVRDIKINGTTVVMAAQFANTSVYDLVTGNVKFLNVYATAVSVASKSSTLFIGGGVFIASVDLNAANGTKTTYLQTFIIKGLAFDFANKNAYIVPDTDGNVLATPPVYFRADLDGKNKKMMQVQPAFDVQYNLPGFSFANGKFYANGAGVDSFNIDGSDYKRLLQNVFVSGAIQFDDVSQHVYWLEGSSFYSCAVYSLTYADCTGMNLLRGLEETTFLNTEFALGYNGMAYFGNSYFFIYSMDMKLGPSSLKVLVKDDRFYGVTSIAIDQSRTNLFVATTGRGISPTIYRVSIADSTVTTLYSNIVTKDESYVPFKLMLTDLTHCK